MNITTSRKDQFSLYVVTYVYVIIFLLCHYGPLCCVVHTGDKIKTMIIWCFLRLRDLAIVTVTRLVNQA